MSNFSCKSLDYMNPNDGGGGRENIKRVFAAATRDQFKRWSKGKCRRAELPPEHCLHSTGWKGNGAGLWKSQKCMGSHRGGGRKDFFCLFLCRCSPPCAASAGRGISIHKPSFGQGKQLAQLASGRETSARWSVGWFPAWRERWGHRQVVWICVTTHKLHKSSVGRDLLLCPQGTVACRDWQDDILKPCVQQLHTLIYCFPMPGTFYILAL